MAGTPGETMSDLTAPGVAGVATISELARLLRELRRREARRRGDAELTYRELAVRTGCSYAIIGQYLTGKVLPPTDRFDALIRVLGATCAEQGALATARDRVDEHRRGPAPVRPPQLPHATRHFTGRVAELAALTAVADQLGTGSAAAIVAIDGTAGVGKTALALAWARTVADRFADGQVYLDLRGFDPGTAPMATAEALRRLLDALGVAPHRVPSGVSAQVGMYRGLLTGRRTLLLLDNAHDAAQVRPLLPGTPGCLVVVTSRTRLTSLITADDAHPLTLDVLTRAEAGDLLTRRIGADRVAADPMAADDIVTSCARLPLALTNVAVRATTNPWFPLHALAAELREPGGGLDAFSGGECGTDLRTALQHSYDRLNPSAARVFRLLGLHTGPDISARAAASLAGRPLAEVRSSLSELTRAHLVNERWPGRYSFHDLLRRYALDRAESIEPPAERHAAVRRLLDHYVYAAHAPATLLDAPSTPIRLEPAGLATGDDVRPLMSH